MPAYEHFTAHQLFHMKDWKRFDKIYDDIIKAAKSGRKDIEVWWEDGDDRKYIKDQIEHHFTKIEIHDGDKSSVIDWSRACEHEQHV